MVLLPIFLKLKGRRCLVVGAGRVAESKIEGLLSAGAEVRVVAPWATRIVRGWAHRARISWEARGFEPADLDGMFLVVAATSLPQLNKRIFERARQRGILCNVADDPSHCDFYYPAVVRRGQLQIAISTSGQSPALAQRLRRELERQFGPEWGGWVEQLGAVRRKVIARVSDRARRRRLLRRLARAGPSGERA